MVVSAISRNATTGFLSLSRSSVICAPEEIIRARWLASSTRSNLFSTLSMQSSTVTRAMGTLLLQWACEKHALVSDLTAEVQDDSARRFAGYSPARRQIPLGVAASLC